MHLLWLSLCVGVVRCEPVFAGVQVVVLHTSWRIASQAMCCRSRGQQLCITQLDIDRRNSEGSILGICCYHHFKVDFSVTLCELCGGKVL